MDRYGEHETRLTFGASLPAGAFRFATEDAGYGALSVRGRHWWPRRGEDKRVVFLYRGPGGG